MMLIKICGVTTVEVGKAVDQYGANLIGFVFAESSRRVTVEQAHDIAGHLSPRLKKVGVFVNESVEKMEEIARTVGLDYIQLHGDEPASIADELPCPVIRARSINELTNDEFTSESYDYFLIDSPGEQYRGGSGKPFNWERLNDLNVSRKNVILAGGLHADNVAEAIKTVNPAGVDVSSGVETDGKKDIKKIKQFINSVRNSSHLKG